ncbi:calpain-6 isoform X2 [Dendropsophus ebraccatus]|uniref:calpain-6 isoform X2 n=1 Tax=Dendropsophus ebraccatus TaxID=150705 RepID=UPI00383120EE
MALSARQLKNQDYWQLKNECKKAGRLFEDPEFPAADESLFYSKVSTDKIEWKRPGVIPEWKKQEWDPKRPHRYAGIFHFQFWCLGNWVDVVIDDRLPSIDGNLIYCHSNMKNEFWSALLEKAYAKLAGSYEALDGGSTADAIVDFTGAVAESIDLSDTKYKANITAQTNLFEDLLKVYKRGGLICCHLKDASSRDMQAVNPMGLIKGHAYSVTGIKKVTLGEKTLCFGKTTKLFMIRMRNPWGHREWKGTWNDESEEWKKVSKSEKVKLGLTVRNDGEFWMTFEDWCNNFTHADVCRIINTSYLSRHKTWEKGEAQGKWTRDDDVLLNRSGGCFNNKSTFFQNPQYIFEVKKEDDEVLVSLQQEDQRIHKKFGKGDSFIIGFEILKVEQNRRYRIHKMQGQERAASPPYMNLRSIFLRKVLKKGRYVIIPTTFHSGVTCEFNLRLFTDEPSNFRELVKDKPSVSCWNIFFGYPKRVSQVLVASIEGVDPRTETEGADLYIVIKCENESVQSEVYKNTNTSAVIDMKAIFYRRRVNKPIAIQVWRRKIMSDQFLGQVLLAASPNDPVEEQSLQLHNKDGRATQEMPGRINVKVVSSDDLLDL